MLSAYQTRRHELEKMLKRCESLQECVDCMLSAMDKIGLETVHEAASHGERAEADHLFRTARQAILCMQAGSDAQLVYRKHPMDEMTPLKERLFRLVPYTALLMGAVLTMWLLLDDRLPAAVFTAIMSGLTFLCIFRREATIPQPEEPCAVARVNVEELMHQFDRLMQTIEGLMESRRLADDEAAQTASESPIMGEDMLETLQMLLEASFTGDGDYALKAMPKLREALRAQGVITIDYSDENRMYFELFPSTQAGKTIRPAFLRDGRLIMRGQATEAIR